MVPRYDMEHCKTPDKDVYLEMGAVNVSVREVRVKIADRRSKIDEMFDFICL